MIREWDPQLLTGNDQVDNQHRNIFRLFNELLSDIDEHKGHREVGRVVSSLSLFVVAHFATEEALMIQAGYPDMVTHQGAHESLRAQVEGLVDQFHDDNLSPAELFNFMDHWLHDHILVHDKPMVQFLIATQQVPGVLGSPPS